MKTEFQLFSKKFPGGGIILVLCILELIFGARWESHEEFDVLWLHVGCLGLALIIEKPQPNFLHEGGAA